jgi:hypothetical protein
MCLSWPARGQQQPTEKKVIAITKGIVMVSSLPEEKNPVASQVARVYRRPKIRIKKALSFQTREDRPKVA